MRRGLYFACFVILLSLVAADVCAQKQASAAYLAELKELAERGNKGAAMTLAEILADGKEAPVDYVSAVRYFKVAADGGNALAMNRLANLYADGKGVQTNLAEAVNWWTKAADLGDPAAEYNLAFAYEMGRGVPRDLPRAAALYEKSALKERIWPMYRLGQMYEQGLGVSKNSVAAIRWLYSAAMYEHPPALYRMGELYAEGKIVRRELDIAAYYFTQAKLKGVPEADQALAKLGPRTVGKIRPAVGTRMGEGPKMVFRGKAFIGSTYPGIDNEAFFAAMSRAVTLTMELPEAIRFRSGLLDTVVYDPPHPQRKGDGPLRTSLGTFFVNNDNLKQPLPLIINHDVKSPHFAPIDFGFIMLEGGRTVAAQRRLIEIDQTFAEVRERKFPMGEARRTELTNEADWLQKRLLGTDAEINKASDCERLNMHYDAARFWKLPDYADRLSTERVKYGCFAAAKK